MNVQRLKILETALRELHTNQAAKSFAFRMNSFFTYQPLHTCESAGCALGYAVLIPAFQSEGLVLDNSIRPSFMGLTGYEAAVEFFNLNMEQVYQIFDPSKYGLDHIRGEDRQLSDEPITPLEVAQRISEMITP